MHTFVTSSSCFASAAATAWHCNCCLLFAVCLQPAEAERISNNHNAEPELIKLRFTCGCVCAQDVRGASQQISSLEDALWGTLCAGAASALSQASHCCHSELDRRTNGRELPSFRAKFVIGDQGRKLPELGRVPPAVRSQAFSNLSENLQCTEDWRAPRHRHCQQPTLCTRCDKTSEIIVV